MSKKPLLFLISLPLILVATFLFGLFMLFAYPAVLIGRKQAFDVMQQLKELL